MTYCEEFCRPMFEARHEDPPCADCPNRQPELDTDGARAFAAWRFVSDQLRVSVGGVFGFDLGAAVAALNVLGLATPEVLLRVRIFADAAIEGLRARGGNGDDPE